MAGERFPRGRSTDAPAGAQAEPRAAARAEAVAVSARHRGVDGPGTPGGDFYARCETAYGTRVIVGQVRGKGAATGRKAHFMASAFRLMAEARPELESLSLALDRLAAASAASEWDAAAREWFATAVLLEIDPQGRRLTVVNHGHPAPLLVCGSAGAACPDAADAEVIRECVSSRPRLPLGLGALATDDGFADIVELPADATLLLFTDGMSEAHDQVGRLFDPAARPSAHSARAASRAPSWLNGLLAEIERHNGVAWLVDLAPVSVRRRVVPVAPTAPVPARRLPAPAPQPRPPYARVPGVSPAAQAVRRALAAARLRAPHRPSYRPSGDLLPDPTMPP